MKSALLVLILLAAALLPAGQDYLASYFFSGQAQGKILLVIPYRVYFQASAELVFRAGAEAEGLTRFSAAGPPGPALLIRTLGFKGRHLAVLVGRQGDHRETAERELARWQETQPDFARYVKNPFFLFFFPETDPDSPPAFRRSRDGRHLEIGGSVRLQPLRSDQDDQVESNFYPMLLAALNFYGHSCLPPENADPGRGWHSEDIDLSSALGELSSLTARIVARLVQVEQEKPFRLNYRLKNNPDGSVSYLGQAVPQVRIWKEFAIKSMIRQVTLESKDGRLLEDLIELEMANQKGIGGRGRVSLRRLDRRIENENQGGSK